MNRAAFAWPSRAFQACLQLHPPLLVIRAALGVNVKAERRCLRATNNLYCQSAVNLYILLDLVDISVASVQIVFARTLAVHDGN